MEEMHGEKMKPLKIVTAAMIGVVLGGVVVGLYYRHLLVKVMSQSIIEASQNKVLYAVNSLTLLREQRTTEFLTNEEEAISSDIYALSHVISPSSITDEQRRLFSMVAHYREKHPYRTGDRSVDEKVEDFLADVRKK